MLIITLGFFNSLSIFCYVNIAVVITQFLLTSTNTYERTNYSSLSIHF